jgi:hypothetical protein
MRARSWPGVAGTQVGDQEPRGNYHDERQASQTAPGGAFATAPPHKCHVKMFAQSRTVLVEQEDRAVCTSAEIFDPTAAVGRSSAHPQLWRTQAGTVYHVISSTTKLGETA